MTDAMQYRELAAALREQGKAEAATAIESLLEGIAIAANSARDARQEIVRQRASIGKLEQQLEIVKGIHYQEMRCHLPEGGHATLRFPDSMTPESAEMLREMVDLQMKFHARAASKRAETGGAPLPVVGAEVLQTNKDAL